MRIVGTLCPQTWTSLALLAQTGLPRSDPNPDPNLRSGASSLSTPKSRISLHCRQPPRTWSQTHKLLRMSPLDPK